ncbi:type II toxin-antitoxin system HicB family antitoxin [Caloranaerobacter azorensis]|uniref:Type II toxin-antitoxin system HicB family antitoxin n=1 Tax=Caloranaerobacter azorensis TaxID=116090 RepID=A0A6P1YAH3_9FIRM|nr:type II toxin-antitoxin system HicB family antitoxin [Caloranaerobacter azorensis]QIB26279.1 type II toxin-antitoxin system HicB family antitoxin [Caloranaerobacter azorensis]
MYKDRYIYPAIFDYAEDGITVEFPDIPGCITCGATTEEALKNAKEALELNLYGIEEDGEKIPEPSEPKDIKLESNQTIVLVEVWMIPVRDYMRNKSVKKTLTIPKWLNDLAEENKVNFSQILQQGLKEYLGIKEYR